MIMENKDLKYYKEKVKEYNKIKKDLERLQFLKDNREDFKVVLDNDISMVYLKNDDMQDYFAEKDIDIKPFDNFHYRSEWNLILFSFAWIEAEFC